MPMFVGESSGARVIQFGIGVSDITIDGTQDVLFDTTTQDAFPGGGGASQVFTQINAVIRHTNGFFLGVTPIVDGQPESEQMFTVSSASVGTDGIFTVKAYFRKRGERVAARIRMTAATDVVELVDAIAFYVPIRQSV